ncbi:hypothetical protein BURPS1710b_2756 [Burkholderia pseudomallei 1710b]|uniref:Uncharacterized protein n=1 Tax=Burkholderia pseudomallei (strain 1710b) TaxID=320372 RepID=Q3JQL2_BURP1|nr:hypothetical protein BURPS1710b_2756 [Burkholderia pseudomallei 1710b]
MERETGGRRTSSKELEGAARPRAMRTGCGRWSQRAASGKEAGGVSALSSARHRRVAARVEPPGDRDARHVERDEAHERRHGRARHVERRAETLRDEEAAVRADRARKAEHRGRFLAGVEHRLLARGFVLALRGALPLGEEDHRDHPERRAVADAREREQHDEHREEAREAARGAARGQRRDHAADGRDHRGEGPERHARAADAIGHPSADGAHQRARERADERVRGRVHVREERLREEREARREADERTEGADVQPAHQPVVQPAEDHRLLGERRLRVGDVIHPEPRGERRDDDERHPHEARVLQPQVRRRAVRDDALRIARERAEQARRDHERRDELHDRHAEVADARVQAGREPFLRLREEEADVRHRRAEVRAAEPAEQREDEERRVARAGVAQREAHSERGNQQRRGRDRGEAAAAEDRHEERIEDAQRRAGKRGQRGEPEQLVLAEVKARAIEIDDDDAPERPDDEREHQRRNRDREIAPRDGAPLGLPEGRVFGIPAHE